MFIVFITLTG